MPSKRPNIVIFNPDSYRGDVLGHAGNAGAVTPALDALVARDAVSFTQAFAQNPVCTPSRCSFMTGWYPHVHGHRSMRNMLKVHEPHLLNVLRREGYHVWWGGKNDLVTVESPDDYLKHCDTKFRPTPTYRGYRQPEALAADDPRRGAFYGGVMPRDPDAEYRDQDRAWVEGAIDAIRNPPSDQPLCLYLPLGFPHPAYHVEAEFYDMIDPDRLPPRIPIPPADAGHPPLMDALRQGFQAERIEDAVWHDVKRLYYGMCAKIDHLFGRVVDALKQANIYDDTLIVFLSDHGDFTGDYSLPEKTHATLQDSLLRVPLVIKPPAGHALQPGLRTTLVELIDMPATIYDLLDIDPGYTVQGQSLRDVLAGSDDPIRDAVFAEVGSRRGESAFRNSEVDRMPPESFYGMQSRAMRPFVAQGTYAVSCRTERYKYVRRAYTDCVELYDLETDPGETLNRHADPALADVELAMERRLLDYFMQTGDILPRKHDSRQI